VSVTLTEPIDLGPQRAASRVMFGPHETNLGRRRAISARHVAYYRRRAAGGCGVIVTEIASVHPSDWPYERAPLAADCEPGWSDTVTACAPHGALVLAGLGHAGMQGSSAFSQGPLWSPSRVPDAGSRELPMEMAETEIDALVDGFADAAARAARSGLDGVEINAGQYSLLRQFASGLTNLRADRYGQDRLLLTERVLRSVRAALRDGALGPGRVLGLRLCCDELAPWAGVTPELAAESAARLAGLVDYLVVVRGSIYSVPATRPDLHTEPGFNTELCRQVRAAAGGAIPVVLQGSVVDPARAQRALAGGAADLVEMTRAQIADPDLVARLRAGRPDRIRPCLLCNQACMVRDNRNPVISCVIEPRSGYELNEADVSGRDQNPSTVLVVGGGPAGMEAARVLAGRGHRVRLAERGPALGGMLLVAAAASGRHRLGVPVDWWRRELARLDVTVSLGHEVSAAELDDAVARGVRVVLATGSVPGPRRYRIAPGAHVVEAADLLALASSGGPGPGELPEGRAVVFDPVGGPVGVGVAELLAAAGRPVSIVTQDQIAGTQLALTGDLAEANSRLQRAGVRRELRSLLREVAAGHVLLEDRWTGEQRTADCGFVVHCGHRLPDEALYLHRPGTLRAGDCVAPRTVLEAVLEARRTAMSISAADWLPELPALTVIGGGR